MKVDISINSEDFSTKLTLETAAFENDRSFSEAGAILTMIAGDYSLDPELETSELKSFVNKAIEDSKTKLVFTIDEDGLDLELL